MGSDFYSNASMPAGILGSNGSHIDELKFDFKSFAQLIGSINSTDNNTNAEASGAGKMSSAVSAGVDSLTGAKSQLANDEYQLSQWSKNQDDPSKAAGAHAAHQISLYNAKIQQDQAIISSVQQGGSSIVTAMQSDLSTSRGNATTAQSAVQQMLQMIGSVGNLLAQPM